LSIRPQAAAAQAITAHLRFIILPHGLKAGRKSTSSTADLMPVLVYHPVNWGKQIAKGRISKAVAASAMQC
jgi:hypothetical protein